MFQNWPEHTAHVKKSFGELGKNHPKMLQAYGALEQAAAAEALDAKTRELIALAVAITGDRHFLERRGSLHLCPACFGSG